MAFYAMVRKGNHVMAEYTAMSAPEEDDYAERIANILREKDLRLESANITTIS